MKIDFIKTFIAIAVSALIAYGFYSLNHSENNQLLVFTSFAELLLSAFLVLGLQFDLNRTTINVSTVASIFFVIFLVGNIAFSFLPFSQPIYVIVNGLIFLTGMLIIYSIIKAKQ